MKYKLPENRSEITLEQYLKYVDIEKRDIPKTEKDKRVFSLFTKIPYKKIGDVVQSDFEHITSLLRESFQKTAKFTNKFELDSVKYGFIPCLDDITLDEASDILTYQLKEDSLHKLCAIYFREIATEDRFGNYTIVPYTGTKGRAEKFLQLPLSIVDGIVVFFLNLSTELKTIFMSYSTEEQKMVNQQMSTLKNGAGTLLDMK